MAPYNPQIGAKKEEQHLLPLLNEVGLGLVLPVAETITTVLYIYRFTCINSETFGNEVSVIHAYNHQFRLFKCLFHNRKLL